MSRRAIAVAVTAVLSAASMPAAAQSDAAQSAVEAARAVYGPQAPAPRCPTVPEGEEIVVCAEEQEQSQFRIPSDADAENDYARETMDKGAPRAPDLFGIPNHGMVTVRGCFIPPCPAPPAVMIDFSKLPDTPPGSDADRVGQGLAPTGDDAGAAASARAAFPGAIVTTIARDPLSPPGSASPAEAPSGSPSPREEPAPE